MFKKVTIWKKILIASLAAIAVVVLLAGIIGACEYFDYRYRTRYFSSLEKRVSEHITMVQGHKAGRFYCQLKDVRTGKFTTPKLNHVFLNEYGTDSLVVFRTCDQLRGYLDINTGQIVIPAQYDRAWNFSEGIAAVIKDGEISFINAAGELAFPTKFPMCFDDDQADFAFQFHNGLCAMISWDHKWGLINTQGEWVVEPIYTRMDKPQYGYRIVSDGLRCGLLTADGQQALPMEYDFIRPASAVRGFTIAKDGFAKIVDTDLKTIIPFVHDGLFSLAYIDGYRDYYDYDEDDNRSNEIPKYWRYDVGNGSGVIDRNGNVIIPAKFFMVRMVDENLFEVEVDCGGDRILFNNKGQVVGKSNV